MRATRVALALAAFALFAFAVDARAQESSRTWVSGTGDDANPCSRIAPCRTFAGAILKTAKDGEIATVTPGSYGAVTITKSVTINGSLSGGAAIDNPSTTAITIDITDAGDVRKAVTLRGLTIQGMATGTEGIRITAATKVAIEDCVVQGQTGHGIYDVRTMGGTLVVSSTSVMHNVGGGIAVSPSSGFMTISTQIARSRVDQNGGIGVAFGSGARAMVSASTIGQNGTGVYVESPTGTSVVAVDHCVVSSNGIGFTASGSAILYVSNTTAMNSGTLYSTANAGQILSYLNNQTGGAPLGTGSANPG
jgi:hypothetical protein